MGALRLKTPQASPSSEVSSELEWSCLRERRGEARTEQQPLMINIGRKVDRAVPGWPRLRETVSPTSPISDVKPGIKIICSVDNKKLFQNTLTALKWEIKPGKRNCPKLTWSFWRQTPDMTRIRSNSGSKASWKIVPRASSVHQCSLRSTASASPEVFRVIKWTKEIRLNYFRKRWRVLHSCLQDIWLRQEWHHWL